MIRIKRVSKKIMILLTIIVSMNITGCAIKKPKTLYVNHTVIKYDKLPRSLVVDDIVLPKPIPKKTYMGKLPKSKEKSLTAMILNLYDTIGKYKLKLKAINSYIENTDEAELDLVKIDDKPILTK